MAAENVCLLASADGSAGDENDVVDAARFGRGARGSWRWLPRCTRCGRWISPPGGEGFGGGEIWCGPCVLRHIQRVASQEGR